MEKIRVKNVKHFQNQNLKIIFLHDEKIFFTRIFFYDLEYLSRVQANTMQRPGQFTALPTARKLIMVLFFVLNVLWRPFWNPNLVDPLYTTTLEYPHERGRGPRRT